ncbi:MAG: DUF3718 domain-containing protein [Gammaproteobacteria bacterium]|nr:DUF3718 domain-containing protein [Gammaproteobacteria bacterium]
MKFLTSLSVTFLLLMSVTTSPVAKADIASALAGICDVVASDNKSRFRKKIKEAGVKLRNIYDGISCGGENLVRYAMQKNAQDTGTFIVKRMPSSHFESSGDADWAAANGFGGTDIAKEIADR